MTSETRSKLNLLLVETSPVGIKGSMSRYAQLVARALVELPGFSETIELRTVRLAMPEPFRRLFSISVGTWLNHLWLMMFGAASIRRCAPDLVHLLDGSFGYVLNRVRGPMVTATVHDLIPLLQQRKVFGPDPTSHPAQWIVRRSIAGLRRCRRLISVSENTGQDLIRIAEIDARSISVVPIALDSIYTEALAVTFPERPPATGEIEPVILHVGNNGQYKNREGVLRIFSLISQSTNARLRLVGPAATSSLVRMVEEMGLDDRVEFIGNVDDLTLRNLYRSASVLLFPSLYEGFGWPPLEAMACGCPVVCSSAGSLAEVVGSAALTAPASDEDALARYCVQVLQNPELAADLGKKGRAHVRQFTLVRMGEQLLEVYESILDEAPHGRSRARSLTAQSGV